MEWNNIEETFPDIPALALVLEPSHIVFDPNYCFNYYYADLRPDIKCWCANTLKNGYKLKSQYGNRYDRYPVNGGGYYSVVRPILIFENDADLLVFKLRWL